jgi:putative flippase GtrA
MQLFRYGLVGIATNAIGYCIYLLITSQGIPPKISVSILYPVSIAIAYLSHGKWTFKSGPVTFRSFWRFVLAYLLGYLINILLLFCFVDVMGYPHQLIQLAAIFVVALQLYMTLKYFVYTKRI